MAAKHQLERATAQSATVFTTVSDITGLEAEKLLKRKPDLLLPNGLDLNAFPSFEEASIKHAQHKRRIKDFIISTMFPTQTFNIDETYLFFTFARYEYRNKGIDVTIKALAALNKKLLDEKSPRTIVMFFFVPTSVRNIRLDVLESKRAYEDLKESVDNEKENLLSNVLINLASQRNLAKETLFSADFLTDTKRKILRFKHKGNPPLCTHELTYPETQDQILTALHTNGLTNKTEDRVKALFYPTYLTGADGLLDLSYYETILGCHLGIFPSVYEPWGYTPLEAGALGVAAVTTDLAGFGKWLCTTCSISGNPGIFVLPRHNVTDEKATETLSAILYRYATFTKEQRIANKIEARRLASGADWKKLIANYLEAHERAVTSK